MIHADLKNADYLAWRLFLRDSEGWSRGQIEDYQLRELKRIVMHAYNSTRGYRDLFDQSGLTPDSIKSLNDFQKFPFIEKEMIRDRLEDFSAQLPGRSYVTTGGSTGITLGMYRDSSSFAKELASKAHQYYRIGWTEGDRQIVFRGLLIDTPNHMDFRPEFNELRCSTYQFLPEQMENFRLQAWEYKPEWIRCYPSAGCLFAQFLKETGRSFPPVKGILCASENFYDYQKELLTGVFKTRIFVHYGHYEMAVLAGFCEHADTYHVLPQYGYAELIREDGAPVSTPGEVGEIVGTSFIMHATPFVRYRTRDLAVFKSWRCSACGRPYQIWERVEGRMEEFILTKGGRHLSTTMLNMHDDFYDPIRQFQFVQREPGKLIFRFVPRDTFTEAMRQEMHLRLLERCLNDVDLSMEEVHEIPLTPRGKQRLLVQELKPAFDNSAFQQPMRA